MKEFATFYRPLLATDGVIDPSAPLRGQAHLLSAYKPFVRTVALGRVSADSTCSKAMGTCGVRPGNVMELRGKVYLCCDGGRARRLRRMAKLVTIYD